MNISEESVPSKYQASPYFSFQSFGFGEAPEPEKMVYGLRYQVYCLERGFLPADDYPDGLEQDEYDPYSTFIAAFSLAGAIVGSMRLIRLPSDTPFPFETHCERLFPDRITPPRGECIEISRLVISKIYRRRVDDTVYGFSKKLIEQPGATDADSVEEESSAERRRRQPDILLGLIRQMYGHSKREGIAYWYVAMEQSLARLLKRFHFAFVQIGEEEDYYGPVAPYVLDIARFDHDLSAGDPALYAWFQDAISE